MNAYLTSVIENVKKHGNELEFVQTVERCSLSGAGD